MADEDLRFDIVDARAEVSVNSFDVAAHPAEEGAYSVIRVRGEGPVTSSDPDSRGSSRPMR